MRLPLAKLRDLWPAKAASVIQQDLATDDGARRLHRFRGLPLLAERLEGFEGHPATANPLPFGPVRDLVVKDSNQRGLDRMIQQLPEQGEYVAAAYDLLGARPGTHDSELRVCSNAQFDSPWESGTVVSFRKAPHFHLASNNYFFVFGDFLRQSRLHHRFADVVAGPYSRSLIAGYSEDFTKDFPRLQDVLRHRFHTKFLWMLGRRATTVHIISLQSYWNLLNSGLISEVLGEESLPPAFHADADFDVFTEAWLRFSQALLERLGISSAEEISRLSELLLLLTLQDRDVPDLAALVETGCRAVILWGPPGTGKTYEAHQLTAFKLGVPLDQLGHYHFTSPSSAQHPGRGRWQLVQFHPSYTYEDFIGGIRPRLQAGREGLSYELHNGPFKAFCDAARAHPEQPFIFIIDEINRANLSAVFGELLYLLEYRSKSVFLPTFGQDFSIPRNVYVLGTMNTVDKSLDAFDLALRRRFAFFHLRPNLETLDYMQELERVPAEDRRRYIARCGALNQALKQNLQLGPDYLIGQAYFKKIADFLDDSESAEGQGIPEYALQKLWLYHLLPLLEEYLGTRSGDDEFTQALEKLRDDFIQPLHA